MGRTLLYIDIMPSHPVQLRKLAGVRRYAALRRWKVVCVPRRALSPDGIRALLARQQGLAGIVVEGSGRSTAYPPRLFGRVPVSYIEYPEEEVAGKAPNVTLDAVAIADTAFRELSLGRPAAFAAAGFRNPHLWSRLRLDAFSNRCAVDGHECAVFQSHWGEPPEAYEARLANWLAALPCGSAIYADGDTAAVSVARAARAVYRSIPHELTLCSTCDIPEISDKSPTPITSIHIDFERMGWLAAKALAVGEDSVVGPLLTVRRKSTAGRGRREPWILHAVDVIRAEACGGLSIDGLIFRLGRDGFAVSRRNFDRRFREAMGHTANEEILSVRLAAATELLLRSRVPVMAISDFCGFGTHAAFDAAFRKRHGMSPGAWRAKNSN
jgi:AraC-like DNA-binding protein